jgi:hypothetical protein
LLCGYQLKDQKRLIQVLPKWLEQTNKILAAINDAVREEVELPYASPFGDGTATQKTIEIIKKNFG